MIFFYDGLMIYMLISKDIYKVEEIENNLNVYILLGYDCEGFGDVYVEVVGIVKVNNLVDLKEKLWDLKLECWFDGKDDLNLVIFEIELKQIKFMNVGEKMLVELEF